MRAHVPAATLLLLALPSIAGAQVAGQAVHSHRLQVGLNVQPGVGYRVLFPYDNGVYCGSVEDSGENSAACVGRAPLFLELGMSFGVSRRVELLVDVRLGLEDDFHVDPTVEAPRAFVVAPGLKYYLEDEASLKLFSTLQAAIDMTDFSGVSAVDEGADYGIRNVNGLQWDFARNVGVYAHFGLTIGFVRWLRFELDGGLGVQARFP